MKKGHLRRWLSRGLPAVVGGLGVLLTGCATIPTGPSVMVLPGAGKAFEQFQVDDALCRQWALQQTGIGPGDAATESGVASAVIGTVIGARPRRGDRRRGRQSCPGSRRGGRRGALRRHGGRGECRLRLGHRRAVPVRRRLSAVHVCEGQPDSGGRPGATSGPQRLLPASALRHPRRRHLPGYSPSRARSATELHSTPASASVGHLPEVQVSYRCCRSRRYRGRSEEASRPRSPRHGPPAGSPAERSDRRASESRAQRRD